MKNFVAKNKNIFISLGTNILLVLFAILVFGTRYATDDDIAMARIAYGSFFEPSTRLVFSCTLFGLMLKLLSGLCGGVNWQLIVYYLSLFYGGTVSLYFVIKEKRRLLNVLWLLVVSAFYYSAYVEVNFSVITSMLAFFGFTTLFIGAKAKMMPPVYLSMVTLLFAMIIRYESFFAVSFFAFIAFALIFVKEIKKGGLKPALIKYVGPFGVALAIPLITLAVDRISYIKEPWASYIEYNDSRSQILDFQSVLDHEDESYFSALGLSEEMVSSLENWQFNDADIFDDNLIIRMSEDSKKYNPKLSTDFIFEAIGYSVEKICKIYYFAFEVLFLGLLTITKDKTKNGGIKIFAMPWIMVVPLVLEISAYYFLDRGIDRVFRTTGLGFWCGIMALLCCGYFENLEELSDKKWMNYCCYAILTLGLICQAGKLRDMKGFSLIDKEEVDEELSFLEDGRIFLCDIDSVRIIQDSYGVWQIPDKGSFYNCVELGGWMVNYPSVKEKQEVLGVLNAYKSLAYNDNAYLLTTKDGILQLEFLQSAYDKNIESELVEKHGELSVYRYKVK